MQHSKQSVHRQAVPSGEGAQQTGNAFTLDPSHRSQRDSSKPQPQQVESCPTVNFPGSTSSLSRFHSEDNRIAARKCRARKKHFVKELKGREKRLAIENKLLKHDIKLLRQGMIELRVEVLRHAGCGLPAINGYIAQRVSDILGVPIPRSLPQVTLQGQNVLECVSTGDFPSDSTAKCGLWDEYVCFDGLDDIDE